MAKAALLKTATVSTRDTVASQDIGANNPDLNIARDNMRELGRQFRAAEKGIIDAANVHKASKADSMLRFAEYAVSGYITNGNFDEWFIMWRYPNDKDIAAVPIKDRPMSSGFRAVVAAAIERGAEFLTAIKSTQNTVEHMQQQVKDNPKLSKPRQADQAVYALANLVRTRKEKDTIIPPQPLSPETIAAAAVPKKVAVVAADPVMVALDSILSAVALFIDPAAAAKAKVALPSKDWRARFVEVSNLIASFKADMIDDESDESDD